MPTSAGQMIININGVEKRFDVKLVPPSQFLKPVMAPSPISATGELVICPACYPMFEKIPNQIHSGHIRHGFLGAGYITVYDGETKLDDVEEAVELDGVPGLYLREFIRAESGALMFCPRQGHVELMVRLRYAPNGRFVVAER